jgi:hypothetical protein
MASAGEAAGRPAHGGGIGSWLAKALERDQAGLNWPRGVMFLDVVLVPLVVLLAIGYEQ